ncbi:MAG TPA: hypothetical protein VFU07_09735 [Candidatus Lumbricidophila sp.]|nr:hypothetical protein [Candidatus Lumbricidophila sp.]
MMRGESLRSASIFDRLSDEELAQWLENDAQAMSGQPGTNNHVAACRAAAERLRSNRWLAAHDEAIRADQRERDAEEVENYWDASGEFVESNNGARLAFEAVAAAIRAGRAL